MPASSQLRDEETPLGESGASDDSPYQAAQGNFFSFAPQQASEGGYSLDLGLIDVQSVTAFDKWGQKRPYINIDGETFKPDPGYVARVQCNRAPAFFANIVDGYRLPDEGYRDQYGIKLLRYVVKLEIPATADCPAIYLEALYGNSQETNKLNVSGWGANTNATIGRPVVNDNTVMASLASIEGYDAARKNIYLNAYKLAPLATAEDIVKSGNAISADSPLATKTITETWPIHETDGMKVSCFEGDEQNLVRATVCFSDGTNITQDMSFLGKTHLAASYALGSAGVLYQPDFWLLGEGAQTGIDRMANFIQSKTFNDYFGSFVTKTHKNVRIHRNVRDNFDVNMHNNAREVAANFLSNIPDWAPNMSSHAAWSSTINAAESATPNDTYGSTEQELKMFNLLFLYAYFERHLGFDIGGDSEIGARKDANPFLVIAFRGNALRSGLSLLSLTPAVRSSEMLRYSKSDKFSSEVLKYVTWNYLGCDNAATLVESVVKRTTGYTDMNDWFADYMRTIAFYEEYEPERLEGVSDNNQLIWRGWDQVSKSRYHDLMLLWLTMEPGAQYFGVGSMMLAIGSAGVYFSSHPLNDNMRAWFKDKLDSRFVPESRYAATLASIVGAQRVNSVCVLAVDMLSSKADSEGTYLETQYSGASPKKLTVDPFHRDFTDPSLVYNSNSAGSGAMTSNASLDYKRIFFFYNSLLWDGWYYVWSHEMAHALDNHVYLGSEGRRAGTEDYTDGLLTQSSGAMTYIMNLSYDSDLSSDRAANVAHTRLVGKENLDDFYKKMYQSWDMLDYALLQAFLRLDKDEQNAVATQARYDGQNGTSTLDSGATAVVLSSRSQVLRQYNGTAATMPMNASAFVDGTRKFETPEEVYDNQIALVPGLGNSGSWTWLWEGYVGTDLSRVWWHPIHSNGVYPDSRSFKLEMYRMLGREGYDAFAEFGRPGGGDLDKLKKITGYNSFKEWQLATWDEIEARKDKLAYVDFDDLVDKFVVALKTDASKGDRNLTQSQGLRTRTYYMMKRVTNDFTNGIYTDESPKATTYIHNLNELKAVANDPYGNYALACDIDATAMEGEYSDPIITGVFYGRFDGAGHRIFSSNGPLHTLFANMKHAYVKDVTLTGSLIQKPAAAVTNSEWENISYEMYVHKVNTVDDFVGIADMVSKGVSKFEIESDLDFTEWSAANAASESKQSSVIAGMVAGTAALHREFKGNGHTISGLEGASLFGNMAYADVTDLTIRDSSNIQDGALASSDGVSLVAKRTHRCTFADLYFKDVELEGKYRVGFVTGDDGFINASGAEQRDTGSQFERIQVMDGKLTNGDPAAVGSSCYAGFVAGRILNSDLTDIYVQGTLATYGVGCGGVVGAITRSSRLTRCVSNVALNQPKSDLRNGVVLGDIENNENCPYDGANTAIHECFGLGSPGVNQNKAGARFGNSAAPSAAAFAHCYENAVYVQGTSMATSNPSRVLWAKTAEIVMVRSGNSVIKNVTDLRNNKELYTSLGFS